jgi:hypothetical protein
VVGTLNVLTAPELASQYQIWGTPTFIVFRDGVERDRRVGTAPYAELAQLLEASISGR